VGPAKPTGPMKRALAHKRRCMTEQNLPAR
jgi:hypothetical protein